MGFQSEENVLVIPDSARVITVDAAYISPTEYARRTGKSRDAVKQLVNSGKLPIRHKDNSRGAVEINMAALLVEALEEVDIPVVAVA